MMALLRSDLYRTLRARWPWAVLALVALATLGSAVFTIWWPLESGVVYDGLTGRSGALRLAGRGASITLVQMVAVFVAAHLSCVDSDAGFDRTLLSSLRGRGAYFTEKYLLVVIVTGVILLAYLAFSGVGVIVTMRPVENVEPLWQVVAWAGEGWLHACAYALVVLLVGQLTRVKAIAVIVAFLLLSAAVEQGFFAFLLLVSNMFGLGWEPALEAAFAWMPYVTTAAVGNGAADMLAVDVTGFAPAVRALIVCAPLCAACGALGTLVGSRRDVA
ncbi:hypothetical protein [Olsenella sp. An293]|uniref:hypothetical protein n=1 Tax=Olsenella sp. An293 TaxID=1965626 RepID=UPI000B3A9163|nr:hypothetical protein [Olsenella sp. An293]OUO31668.1 hypothetical protein B5F85_09745 [Olsenella sp. An293]